MRDAAQTILNGVDTLMDEGFSELKLKCLTMIQIQKCCRHLPRSQIQQYHPGQCPQLGLVVGSLFVNISQTP